MLLPPAGPAPRRRARIPAAQQGITQECGVDKKHRQEGHGNPGGREGAAPRAAPALPGCRRSFLQRPGSLLRRRQLARPCRTGQAGVACQGIRSCAFHDNFT